MSYSEHRPFSGDTRPRLSSAPPIHYAPLPGTGHTAGAPESGPLLELDPATLARKYWLLVIAFLVLGTAAGFISVVLQTPVYRAGTMIEIQGLTDTFLKGAFGGASSSEENNLNVQTQIRLIQSVSFLQNVITRLTSETVPPIPSRNDIFSRLRSRLRPDSQDPMTVMRSGVARAQETFQVRSINGTRLIEIVCESTHPDIAAIFVNTLAAEYVEQANQSRSQNTQKAASWLTSMLEEAKIRYQEAESKLNSFVQQSGLRYVGDEAPLSDLKLRQLKAELTAVQSERIAKQVQYELINNKPVESLPEVLGDETLRKYQSDLSTLKQELARLQTTYTPAHNKVRAVEAQVVQLEATIRRDAGGIAQKIRNEYEGALRKERLLSAAYTTQSRQIISEADKASEFSALKREVEIAKQAHNALLLQVNQVNNASSATVQNMRMVDPATPPQIPYKPRPVLSISFGAVFGLAASIGIVFLREIQDRSVRTPGQTKELLRVPELGVIPSSELHEPPGASRWRLLGSARPLPTLPEPSSAFAAFSGSTSVRELIAWSDQSSLVTESFRSTLASLMLGAQAGRSRTIVISSPGPGEGKTTVTTNLGVALAESGKRVLIIDADLRAGKLHRIFGVDGAVSLPTLLSQEPTAADHQGWEDITTATAMPGLYILPNNGVQSDIQRLLYSPRLAQVLDTLRPHFDVILIDTPPALLFADARILARYAEGVVLVLRAGTTARDSATQAFHKFHEDGTPLLGTVLNDWRPARKASAYYHSYYDRSSTGTR